jgi:hypothetical protein
MARGRPTLQFRLDGGDAGRDIHQDGEERQQERGDDRRNSADAEPQDQDRHHRDFRDGVEADQRRIEAVIDQRRRADGNAGEQAEGDRERETDRGLDESEPGILQDDGTPLPAGGEDRARRRQDERLDAETVDQGLPEQKQRGDDEPRQDAAKDLAARQFWPALRRGRRCARGYGHLAHARLMRRSARR